MRMGSGGAVWTQPCRGCAPQAPSPSTSSAAPPVAALNGLVQARATLMPSPTHRLRCMPNELRAGLLARTCAVPRAVCQVGLFLHALPALPRKSWAPFPRRAGTASSRRSSRPGAHSQRPLSPPQVALRSGRTALVAATHGQLRVWVAPPGSPGGSAGGAAATTPWQVGPARRCRPPRFNGPCIG